MIDSLILQPFDRRRVGSRNQFVFRRHNELPELAVKAIAKREHPAWSSQHVEFRVSEAA